MLLKLNKPIKNWLFFPLDGVLTVAGRKANVISGGLNTFCCTKCQVQIAGYSIVHVTAVALSAEQVQRSIIKCGTFGNAQKRGH